MSGVDQELTPLTEQPAWHPPTGPPIPPWDHEAHEVGPTVAPLTDTAWSVNTAFWLVAGFAFMLVLAALGAALVQQLKLGVLADTIIAGALISAAYLLTVGVVAYMARKRGTPLFGAVGLRPVPVWPLLGAALVAAILGRLLAAAWGLLLQALGVDVTGAELDPTKLFAPGPIGIVILVLVTVVLAPVVEEMVFRGVLLPALAARWGTTTAVLGSSAAFAVIHLSPIAVPAVFLFAVLLGRLFLRTRSLLTCIVAHAIFNAFGLAAIYALKGSGLL